MKRKKKYFISISLFSCFTGLRISDIDKEDNIISSDSLLLQLNTQQIQQLNMNESAKNILTQKTIFPSDIREYIN
jgi:hypothetical protein